MKKTLMALMAIAGVATAQAATLDLDITGWNNKNYDLSQNQYDVINVFGDGSVNFDVFYAADTGTEVNISEGATVHLNDIVVSNGPVGIDLDGGAFDFFSVPTITVILDQADLTKEGEIVFPYFYYISDQPGGDSWANYVIMNTLFDSPFSFVNQDGTPYEYMTVEDNEMDLAADMALGLPVGSAVFSVKATNTQVIPEPTTATLSLLALAGLAARRRRK